MGKPFETPLKNHVKNIRKPLGNHATTMEQKLKTVGNHCKTMGRIATPLDNHRKNIRNQKENHGQKHRKTIGKL
jgi:hypothetical protein